ncbi:helix-turn-helix domain-containing protein [Amycolatopsis sp. SID8362]|uniref:helix-turn-helix domain-containing protein n=1 Tax=Amycolatopsis sp. SID8362 TaxID=2690346 RepID=UPI00136E20E1|nr:helix-turn-helix domain-containing protein [Amycolatopsis sp. SID8362]NBH02893.1 XRE family transcriptional regulator [Amycolatopsis sp. SID8362]NED39594.1 helix-turn-helix transcriptional regulator [Amycolatopsis sp. SID8362]
MAERPERRDFADKLNHLFAVTKSPDGDEYSNDFVAESITATGTKISGTYIWQLRKRKRDNPTIKHVEGLAKYFGVPFNYFFDDDVTGRVDQQLKELADERDRLKAQAGDNEAQRIAMRAGELSPHRRQLVMDLLDVVYRDQQAEQEREATE